MKTTQQMIDVMTAYVRGENIEYQSGITNLWLNSEYPIWDWNKFDYRVKPNPLECWVLTVNGCVTGYPAYGTKEAAERHSAILYGAVRVAHMREVIE